MKKLRVSLALVLVCISVLSMSNHTFATDLLDSHEIEPCEIAPCPKGNGIHQMWSKAISSVKDYNTGKVLFLDAGLYQCANCGEVIIVEGSPEFGLPIMRYVYQQAFVDSYYDGSLFIVYVAKASSVNYTNSNRLPGFRFLKSTPFSEPIVEQ